MTLQNTEQINLLSQQPLPQEICRYSDAVLNHLPKKALKIIEKDISWRKKSVIILDVGTRRSHSDNAEKKRTNQNFEDKENKSVVQIDSKYVYSVPLKYFWDLDKINFPTKIDLKICYTLQTQMEKLFELKKKVNTIGAPDA